ncbi:MAG: bifunctional nicotinamidase/pyrazinamidase [Acidobacteriota bacterium]|nr:bifunctional nicotinamidase/pyrazinamidase [Acidobacteriota bacterium]
MPTPPRPSLQSTHQDTLQDAALLVIDLQLDFCPALDGIGGALAVESAHQIVPLVNSLGRRFPHVILTQDWHPAGHISFASSHPGCQPYQQIQAPYGPQTLWPEHCLQGSSGAALHPALDLPHAELILRKGFRTGIDSYSAFLENDHTTPTGLAGYLRERGIRRLYLCGLALDFCVRYSALDGKALGFDTAVMEDATRAVGLPGSVAATHAELASAGVPLLRAAAMGG